jgi:hypothetical protein
MNLQHLFLAFINYFVGILNLGFHADNPLNLIMGVWGISIGTYLLFEGLR